MSDRLRDFDRWEELKARLGRSSFRRRFNLTKADLHYVESRGLTTIREHARKFVSERLAAAEPRNDGHQTPMRGHPVFVAQHATGTCCRKCLKKWHWIPQARPLTPPEQAYVVEVILCWIAEKSFPHLQFGAADAYSVSIPARE